MKRSDTAQRQWLVDVGNRVAQTLRVKLSVGTIAIRSASRIRAVKSDADGWYVEVGHVRPDRGSGLQVWLDRWARTNDRKLWFGYKGTRQQQIRIGARAGTPEFGPAYKLLPGAWSFDRQQKVTLLRQPLKYFGVPVAELYTGVWAFYGIYLRRTPDFSKRASPAIIERIATFAERVALGVANQLEVRNSRERRSAVEGHSRYRQHLVRERAPKLAFDAKVRDGFTCRVCGINFEQLYGKLGHAFAEAHHVVPLSKLTKARRNTTIDIATVCANCHRMLHRLPANTTGLSALKRRFTRVWPVK